MIARPSRRLAVAVVLAMAAGSLFGSTPAGSAVPADPDTVRDAGTSPRGTVTVINPAEAVPDGYIVELRTGTSPEETPRIADELTRKFGVESNFVYTGGIQGFAVKASRDKAELIAGDTRVAKVTQDQFFTLDALVVQPAPPSWGLDRIDERSLPRDNKYHYPNTASSVTAFIIDTGILLTHQEFGGRAICGFDPFLLGCGPCTQTHGTHVAGTVGGSTVGVAKGVRIVSVNVFGCSSSTTGATVIAGVNFVTLAQQVNPAMRSVANMSLGGGLFPPLDNAVTASIAANVHYSVAAGNSNLNACTFSPAATPNATTVGATDINDNRAAFSNFGPCLDLFAPGVGIVSASSAANNAYVSLSGTSMASPHAAGTAALWRHKFPADNAVQTATALAANATPGVVINPGAGSPNLLLFMGMVPV
jgi:subtilisin family serine protease